MSGKITRHELHPNLNQELDNINQQMDSYAQNIENINTEIESHATSLADYINFKSQFYIQDADKMGGTVKGDTNCQNGKCIFANTSTTADQTFVSITINTLRLGDYSLMVRMKSLNNTSASDAIKIDIQKNNNGTFTSMASRIIKPIEFLNTTDYNFFYMGLQYNTKATNNELKIVITVLKQTTVFEVDLDYIQIMPSVVGVFNYV